MAIRFFQFQNYQNSAMEGNSIICVHACLLLSDIY